MLALVDMTRSKRDSCVYGDYTITKDRWTLPELIRIYVKQKGT
jgi:hypothetical protein